MLGVRLGVLERRIEQVSYEKAMKRSLMPDGSPVVGVRGFEGVFRKIEVKKDKIPKSAIAYVVCDEGEIDTKTYFAIQFYKQPVE
jgi:hypothetical protein